MFRDSERRRQSGATQDTPPVSLGRLLSGVLSLLFSAMAFGGVGMSHAPQTSSEVRPTFRAAAETVLLEVSVLDDEGVPVEGLERHHFAVYEDGLRQEISFFERSALGEGVPAAIVLLIDTSSSMKGGKLLEAQRAASRFLEEAPARAEIAVLAFDHEPRAVRGFTTDRGDLADAVRRLDAGGGTALYDALWKAAGHLEGSKRPRQMLVVLSDGKDLDSLTPFGEVRKRLESSSIVVYSVGCYSLQDRRLFLGRDKHFKAPPLDENLNPSWVLREASRISGGRVFFPGDASELEPLFGAIARGIGLQYHLGYVPPATEKGPRFRRVEVRLQGSFASDALTVRTRPGYLR